VTERVDTGVSLIEASHLGKRYATVQALADVGFTLRAGEVHALIGENGAGKSTLVKIVCGEIGDYAGSLVVRGARRRFDSPRQALAAGIAVIPQELQMVTSLSVAENILLGREPRGPGGLVDRDELHRLARQLLDAIETSHIGTTTLLGSLDAANRQLVAIARALSFDAQCLIMDEPTASLGAAEAVHLAQVIRRLASQGTGIVYVSHQLGEVRRLADRVTVLRDGRQVITRPAAGLTEDEMVRLMCGRQIVRESLIPVGDAAPVLLRIEHLDVIDPTRPGGFRLRDVSFTVRRGEIVGLAGLIGAGRTDLLLALVGALDRTATGRIVLDGQQYVPGSPVSARDAGMVMLPEERKTSGIFPHLGIDRNITISALDRVSRWGWLNRRGERSEAERMMADTGVRAAGAAVPIGTLSGGNQQKALLARCLFASPTVLLLDEPTRGIDLAAKADVYAELRALAARGFGIVLCSSEMSEVLTQCHRIVVFRAGRVVSEFDRDDATEESVLAAAAGQGSASPDIAEPDGTPSGGAPPPRWRERALRLAGAFGLGLVLLLAIVTSPVRGGHLVFLDLGNLADILRQVSEKGILAVGMTAVVISGGIDLSVGSVLAIGATLSAWLWMRHGVGLGGSVVIVTAVGALWGLLNGVVIARWRLPAFIATLATMSAARGAARYLSDGSAIPLGFGAGGAPASVRAVAAPLVPYVPVPALIFGLTALAMHFYLARTRSGRYVYAIGDNEAAARLAGVRVAWHKASVYVICAALAAIAGLVHAAQLEQGNPNDGVAYELDAIAAVVIGGTTLSGGSGTVGGTIIGILIIGVINNSMGLNNIDANLQLILKGVIILVAVWLQRRRPAT
jgi:ABC-type sugar transport system ATPase subunit/ribose/xylose/arabinose/galactoside ABC-type transport system permease subunit